MARIVKDISKAPSQYILLTQTPPNYSKSNYFIKELQDKVDADWNYRPNRVDIEYEIEKGVQEYSPIEVVIDSVKSEKGEDVSDDCRKIIFRDIQERRFNIGSRFRFSPIYDLEAEDEEKDVWIATNTNMVKFTSSLVIEKCNGTLGSLVTDSKGVARPHYEPVIQERNLTAASLMYNDSAATQAQSQLVIVAQYNQYSKKYRINQRFIIGNDADDENNRLYRIKAINKFSGNSTFKSGDVGLMRLYLEETERSPYDNFETRIAYQEESPIAVVTEEESYQISFSLPEVLPKEISFAGIKFKPVLLNSEGEEVSGVTFSLSANLSNLIEGRTIDNYVSITQQDNEFTIVKKCDYSRGKLTLTWSTTNPGNESETITLVTEHKL